MKHLCPRIDDLEQYSRKNCLLKFSGISQNSDKKTLTRFWMLLTRWCYQHAWPNSHWKFPSSWSSEIQGEPPRDTAVHLARYTDHAMVFPNKRNLKTYNNNDINLHRISINEVLNKTRVQLFTRLCKYKCNGLIHSHWTFEGQLFMKILNAVGKTLV